MFEAQWAILFRLSKICHLHIQLHQVMWTHVHGETSLATNWAMKLDGSSLTHRLSFSLKIELLFLLPLSLLLLSYVRREVTLHAKTLFFAACHLADASLPLCSLLPFVQKVLILWTCSFPLSVFWENCVLLLLPEMVLLCPQFDSAVTVLTKERSKGAEDCCLSWRH